MPPRRATTSSTPTAGASGLALPGGTPAWSQNQIPIDPALKGQGGMVYPGYYYPPGAGGQYPMSASQILMQHATTLHRTSTSTSTGGSGGGGGGGGGGSGAEDIANMNDVLSGAGVDLRAEEEGLHRSHSTAHIPYQQQLTDRSRRQVIVNSQHLGHLVREIASHHKVSKVPEESVQYLAFALRARLEEIIKDTISTAKFRLKSDMEEPPATYPDGTPMWSKVVRKDVGKQLAVLERVEREEEMKIRQERKARQDPTANGSMPSNMDDGEGEDEGGPKKKRKKEAGPGVTAKNMTEEVRKKMSNAAASHAAGLSTAKYSWMHAGNVPSGGTAKAKAAAATASSSTTTGTSTTPTKPATGTGGGWARGGLIGAKEKEKAVEKEEDTRMVVTLRDAQFVIERERGHGGGRGSARGWT